MFKPRSLQSIIDEIELSLQRLVLEAEEQSKDIIREQQRAIADESAEVKKIHRSQETETWAGKQNKRDGALLNTRGAINGPMLSPLGVQAIIDERNTLKFQLRDAASQVVRTQHLWKIELAASKTATTATLAQRFLGHLKVLRGEFEREVTGLQKEIDRLNKLLDDSKFDFIALEQSNTKDRGDSFLRLREKDIEIAGLKQHISSLEGEIKHVKEIGKETLMRHLASQREHLLADAQNKLDDEVSRVRVELLAEARFAAKGLQSELEARYERVVKMEVASALKKQEHALIMQSRMEKLKAVDDVIEAFREENIGNLSARSQLQAMYEGELEELKSRTLAQRREIDGLRHEGVNFPQSEPRPLLRPKAKASHVQNSDMGALLPSNCLANECTRRPRKEKLPATWQPTGPHVRRP